MPTENGWEPHHAPADMLEWRTIPGTNPKVSLQFLKGWPSTILTAYAADYNAYVEPLRDADSASFTATNSVPTSNHLNGTAMDLNWNSHAFRVSYAGFDQPKIARMRELLSFYNYDGLQIVFWAQDWDNPKDAMHHQMGYNTWNNPKVLKFINERIRPDGFSTYKRGGASGPVVPPPAPALTRAEGYAKRIIAEGKRRGITPRGIQIALATALVESNITVYANEKLPKSLALPHDAVGRDGLSVGIFQQQVKDTGNGWWWGDEATCMGVESSAGLFYDRLAKIDYNGPNSPGSYAQAIQRSAYPGRYDERMGEAVALYNKLAGSTTPAPPPPPSGGDDDMALTPEQDMMLRTVFRELTQKHPSRSGLREPGEGVVDTWAGMDLNTDGNVDFLATKARAELKYPPAIARLERVANNRESGRSEDDALLAQAILASLGDHEVQSLDAAEPVTYTYAPPTAVSYVSPPAPVVEEATSAGQIIGKAYDAVRALELSGENLTPDDLKTLQAFITLLQTKTKGGKEND